jgi:hypothetical protein
MLQLAPVKPRPGSNYFEKRRRDEVEIHFLACRRRRAKPGLPVRAHHRADARARARAPLIDRWQAMLEALQGAARNALPAHCSASKRKAQPKPYIVPIPKTHAMHRAVALVSGGLTVQLIEALRAGRTPTRADSPQSGILPERRGVSGQSCWARYLLRLAEHTEGFFGDHTFLIGRNNEGLHRAIRR